MRAFAVLTCLSVMCAFLGCNKMAEQAAEQAIEAEIAKDGGSANVDIDGDGFSMEIKGDDGDAVFKVGSGAKVPADFPKDVPVYQGMTINMAHTQQQKSMYMIQATSSDSLDKIAAFYEQEAAQEGWTEESTTKGDKIRMSSWTKDERMMNVALAAADEGTSVTINTAQK